MEEQASAQTLGDGALGVLSISLAEIPDTASGDNDELGKSNEEGVVPEETKNVVSDHSFLTVCHFNISKDTAIIRVDSSCTDYVNC